MYQFRIIAHTQTGESIGIVGSAPELGGWDIRNYLRLQTNGDRYPIWWTDDLPLTGATDRIEYKYVRIDAKGNASWEAWGIDRWIPIDPARREETIVIDDGAIGYLQPYPFGYVQRETQPSNPAASPDELKIAVIGSSVAWGQKAWLLAGWAGQLGHALQDKYGHQLVNVAEVGANIGRTISRFDAVVTPERPDLVIIALSLGNEGFAHCHPRDRRTVQRRFESGLQQLVKMTRDIGARPILGGVYPHNDYHPEHRALLQETHDRMLKWGVPVLDWLAVLDDGVGRWKAGISFDPAHPNTLGHQLMFEAIDLRIFDVDRVELARERQYYSQPNRVSLYSDNLGFELWLDPAENRVTIANHSTHDYTIAPYWQQLQTALKQQAKLLPGVYITSAPQAGMLPFFAVRADGSIDSTVEIPADSDLEYTASFEICTADNPQLFFDNGEVRMLRSSERQLWIINESDHEYNIQPMWEEVSTALTALPAGVYTDPLHPNLPFRTLTIGDNGLESRVKVPAQSAIWFEYHCKLSVGRSLCRADDAIQNAVRWPRISLRFDTYDQDCRYR